jgi:hypothetical protein
MNKLAVLLIAVLVLSNSLSTIAQVEKCGTVKLLQEHLDQNPALQSQMQASEANANAWADAVANKASTIITIPTVVHVIHNLSSPNQNIPDSVIFSQIDVLNEDFRRMNADAVNTRPIFDSIAADVEVQFCLAAMDTAGNTITGINRVATTETGFEIGFGGMDDMKFTASGGADAWPRDEYLNMWVCNMTFLGIPGAILGFAQFPGDDASTDGVVIQYNFVGRTLDPVQSDSSLGRTTTHEVGHWLGLRHIWADDQDFLGNATCDSSDFVDDTPNQEGQSNYDCNININSCSAEAPYWGTTDPPDMVENYMDYSADDCSNMFSVGQKTRMLSFLNTDRLPLLSATACTLVGLDDVEASQRLSLYPNPCSGIFNIKQEHLRTGTLLQVFNSFGQLVFEKSIKDDTSIDVSHLSSGMYCVRKLSGASNVSTRLLISE